MRIVMKSFNHLETPQLEELKSETTENGRHYFTPTGEKYPSRKEKVLQGMEKEQPRGIEASTSTREQVPLHYRRLPAKQRSFL